MAVSQNRGTPIWTQYVIFFFMGTTKKVPLILGNPHVVRESSNLGVQKVQPQVWDIGVISGLYRDLGFRVWS